MHWDGAKTEDGDILIVGDGPATSTPAPQTEGKLTGIDPKAVVYTTPNQYKRRDPTDAAPTNQVILHGDPTKPGPLHPDQQVDAGKYQQARTSTKRSLHLGAQRHVVGRTGNNIDPDQRCRCRRAPFVTHFGKQVHWDGAKDEEAIMLIVGEGPSHVRARRGEVAAPIVGALAICPPR